jgi:uncharacterized protein YcbK (DUF882 family)
MNSKLSQKLFVLGLVVTLCFLAACGKSSASNPIQKSGDSTDEGGTGVTPTACYVGVSNNNLACVPLKTIEPKSLGYKNPFTDSTFMHNANKEQYRMPVQGVDLAKASPSLKVAPNFKLIEIMSAEKDSFGIFSPAVLKIVQKLRDQAMGALKINSGFRPPHWNEGVPGSAKWSRHQYGDAVDIASPTASLDKLVELCRSLGASYVDKYVVHVHCDWRNKTLDPSFFGAVNETLDTEENQMNILSELKETSQIVVSGELKAGNIILLSSNVTYKDDDDELYKRWIISRPNGDQMDVEQAEVSLPVQKGVYHIVHYIGANITLNKTIVVH